MILNQGLLILLLFLSRVFFGIDAELVEVGCGCENGKNMEGYGDRAVS